MIKKLRAAVLTRPLKHMYVSFIIRIYERQFVPWTAMLTCPLKTS